MLPNFLIIGAGKSGTTSLLNYLNQHPQIYLSPKRDCEFFAREGEDHKPNGRLVGNIKDYEKLFLGVRDEPAVGESSNQYLVNPNAPNCIKKHIPDVKLIAILRDPAERCYSGYMMRVCRGAIPYRDFTEYLKEKPMDVA